MVRLRTADLVAVLDLLEDARSLTTPEPFTREFVDRLMGVVGCEYGRYKEMDFVRRVDVAYLPCSAEVTTSPTSWRR